MQSDALGPSAFAQTRNILRLRRIVSENPELAYRITDLNVSGYRVRRSHPKSCCA